MLWAFLCAQVDKEEQGWTGETGHVTASLIETHLPKPSGDSMIFVCGPPGMMNVSVDEAKGIAVNVYYIPEHTGLHENKT